MENARIFLTQELLFKLVILLLHLSTNPESLCRVCLIVLETTDSPEAVKGGQLSARLSIAGSIAAADWRNARIASFEFSTAQKQTSMLGWAGQGNVA